jgi:hypothetical protein
MKRILTIAAVLLATVLVGCNTSPVQPFSADTTQSDSLACAITEPIVLAVDTISNEGRPQSETAALSATYASSLQQIGWSDWIATFYLPYNPGTVTFQGRLISGGQWQTFSGWWAQIWDARYTPYGFRVQILMGARVFGICGPTTGRYRLLY